MIARVCTRRACTQKRPHLRPAPSRPSTVELSSECPRSHSQPTARTAASKTSLTARALRVHRPGLQRAPPSSHRRLQWPSASCTCTSAMHERDRPGGYGGRHRHCLPPPGLLPFTCEEAFEAFVVRPALSKFRIRRPLINRADLGYHVCGNGTRAVVPRRGLVWKQQQNMEDRKRLRLFATPSKLIRLQTVTPFR